MTTSVVSWLPVEYISALAGEFHHRVTHFLSSSYTTILFSDRTAEGDVPDPSCSQMEEYSPTVMDASVERVHTDLVTQGADLVLGVTDVAPVDLQFDPFVNCYVEPDVNEPPVAEDDAYTTDEDDAYTTDEDGPLNVAAPGVLDNDSDADGDPLTAVLVSGPSDPGGGQMGPVVITQLSNATLTLYPDGSFSYTPSPDFFGTDTFTYVAHDGLLDSNVATVTITVNPIDDAPVAADDTYATDVDWMRNVAAPGVLGNDRHPDGDPITAIEVTAPSSGTLSLSADGSFGYTPDPGFAGTDAFTYKAHGGLLDSNVATVTIHVGPSRTFADGFESGDTTAWSNIQ